jgi:glycosyltransferase involved in cell wall biosynthesis
MKVTMLSNAKGGLFSFSKNLIHNLVNLPKCKYKIKLIFLEQTKKNELISDSKNIKQSTFTNAKFAPNLPTILDFFLFDRPDILHINFALFWSLAVFKKYVFKTPFILTLHGFPQPWLEPSFGSKIKYILESMSIPFAARHASAIVTVSNFVKKMLRINYGLNSEVIYNGIEINTFIPTEKELAKKQMGYEKKQCVILFVGNLHPYKDPLTLIKAFNEAIKTNNNLRLIIVGAGELDKEVNHTIKELNIQNYVNIYKQLNDEELRRCYIASDIFVLPSINEAFGIVLLEAMASGAVVIASNSGACPEIIQNAGILFAQGNHLDLAEKIIKTSSNKTLLEKLRNKGITRVGNFSWKETSNKYWTLYQKIINHVN